MRGRARCHGAATIVNAIATGKGAAFGIDLFTEAEVELFPSEEIRVEMDTLRDPGAEDPSLAVRCVENVLNRFSDQGLGGLVKTRSNIPISRGLKSSSAAANAIVQATLNALDVECESLEVIRMGTRSAVESGVSVTGAFDDATASMLGGVILTDNEREEIIKRDRLPSHWKVVLHTPEFKIRKNSLPLEKIRSVEGMVEIAFNLAKEGEYARAMTLNGLAYSAALGLSPSLAVSALQLGAVGAGLSGTGPATAILVEEENVDSLVEELGEDLIVTDLYHGEKGDREDGLEG